MKKYQQYSTCLCTFVEKEIPPLKLLSVLCYHKKGIQEKAESRRGVDVEEIPKRSPLQPHPTEETKEDTSTPTYPAVELVGRVMSMKDVQVPFLRPK